MFKDHDYKLMVKELLATTNDGFIVINKDGIIEEISLAYCEFLDRNYNDIIGKPIGEVISTTSMYEVLKSNLRGDGPEGVYLQVYSGSDNKSKADTRAVANRFCFYDEGGRQLGAAAQVYFRDRTAAMNTSMMQQELAFYKEAYNGDAAGSGGTAFLPGEDPLMKKLRKKVQKVAQKEFPVLITGETGTGKEMIARTLHRESSRRNKPMITINCAAIPAELLESELFGYEEGAFTGAKRGGKIGKFELAQGGTLFLDEIGDMPLELQAKLLRVLQEREVERIGGTKAVPIDVRIIAATRQNLPEMIQNKTFREDLYYRLNVISLETVPLREHKSDIMLYAYQTLDELNRTYKTGVVMTDAVKQRITHYDWPGNVRELINVITGAYASCDTEMIDEVDLPARLLSKGSGEAEEDDHRGLKEIVADYEASVIRAALRRNEQNCSKAAKELGIDRSLLYRKMQKAGIVIKKEIDT